VDDGDAQPGGGRDVDGVQPHPVASDHLELRAGGHEALGAARLGPEQDALRLGGDLHQAGLGLVVADDDAGTGLEVGAAVGVDGPGEDDEGTVSGHGGALLSRGRANYR
jgi:hypothetical protein